MSDEPKKTDPSVLKKLVDNLGGAFGGLVGQETQNLITGRTHAEQDFERLVEGVKNHVGGAVGGVVGQEIQNMINTGPHATLQANEKTLERMIKTTKDHIGGAVAGVVGQEIQNTITGGTHVAEHGGASATPGNVVPKPLAVRRP